MTPSPPRLIASASGWHSSASFVTLVIAVGAGLAASRVTPTLSSMLLASIAAILIGSCIARAMSAGFDPLEPIYFFALAYAAMFVVRPASIALEGSYVYAGLGGYDIRSTFDEMLLVALIGAAAFVGGYTIRGGRALAERLPNLASYDTRRVASLSLLIGLAAILLFVGFLVTSGGVGRISLLLQGRSPELEAVVRSTPAYFTYGPLLLTGSALTLYGLGRTHGSLPLALAGVALALILVVIRAPTGGRGGLFTLAAGFVLFTFLRRQFRPRAITVLALVLGALVLSSVALNLRQPDLRGSVGSPTAQVKRTLTPEGVLSPVLRGADAEMAPALAVALDVIPEDLPHRFGGATFVDLVTRWIPRALWDEKPLPPREALMAHISPSGYFANVDNREFSALMVLYWDWGLLGLLGFGLYGLLGRCVLEYLRLTPQVLPVQLLYSLSLPLLVFSLRDGIVDSVIRAVLVLGPVVAVFWLGRRRSITSRAR